MSKNTITAILRRRDGRGQALPLFALMLPVLLAFMALGMDASRMYAERRDAQGAADLAALAGLDKLPDQVSATAEALAVTSANGYAEAEVTVTFPQANRIRVVVREEMNTFFAPILTSFFDAGRDWDTVAVEAAAAAVKQEAFEGNYAVIGLKDECDLQGGGGSETVDWGGSDHILIGGVHSNSGLKFHGGRNVVQEGPVSYGCEGEFTNSGNNPGILFPDDPPDCPADAGNQACLIEEPLDPMDFDPPIYFDWSTFNQSPNAPCNFSSSANNWTLANDSSVWVGDKSERKLKAGKYCNPGGKITVSASGNGRITVVEWNDGSGMICYGLGQDSSPGAPCGVTFYAQEVNLSGSGDVLTAYDRGVLAFASHEQDNDLSKKPVDRINTGVYIQGSGLDLTGFLYAPKGLVKNTGSGNSGGTRLTGGIIGQTVDLAGSGMTIDGRMSAVLAPPYQGLVE